MNVYTYEISSLHVFRCWRLACGCMCPICAPFPCSAVWRWHVLLTWTTREAICGSPHVVLNSFGCLNFVSFMVQMMTTTRDICSLPPRHSKFFCVFDCLAPARRHFSRVNVLPRLLLICLVSQNISADRQPALNCLWHPYNSLSIQHSFCAMKHQVKWQHKLNLRWCMPYSP